MSNYLFGGGPLLHQASVIYSHEGHQNDDAIGLSQSLWDAVNKDAGLTGSDQHVLAVSIRASSERQRRRQKQKVHPEEDDKPLNSSSGSSSFAALTVWATIDTNVPASSDLLTIPMRFQSKYPRIFPPTFEGLPSTAIASPTLTSNILSTSSSTNATNSTITIHPAPFSSSHSPPIPTATTATIARIASPHASDKTFQPLFLRALKRYFQGRVRVVKEGDIVAVPIWVEQAELLKSGASGKDKGKDGEDGGEKKDGKDDGEEVNEDILDYEWVPSEFSKSEVDADEIRLRNSFALSSTRPSNVVFFKITNLEYDILDTSGSGRELDSYVAATMGELGCLIDPTVTKMVQTGLEHAQIPDVRQYFDIDTGFCALPASSRLITEGSPFAKLRDVVQAALVPSAVDYDLPISVLLKGSRGIGKQTVARWVAEDLGVHVYEINCFNVVGETEVKTEGILRARFERAANCSPCIFLLRHIEALAKTTQSVETGREPPIIPALRECIDELRQGWRVSGYPTVLVATTSDPEHVPVGVLGCFKHEIAFEVPNEPERLDVLGTLLEGLPLSPDVSVQSIATQTAALVAADLVDLVERAKLASMERVFKATSGTQLCQADLTAAGIQLTAADFDVALAKARASYSESIGAPKIPNVSWDDVGGLANVKQDILDTIQLPLEHPELFADGLKKRSGILLYGPPGTGKTLLAKAVATSCSLNFFSVKGPELLNMYIGEFDRMLYLGVSDTHDAQLKIIQALTRKFRLDPALDLRVIAEQCPFNYTGADFYALCSDAMLKAMSRKAQEVDAKIGPYIRGRLAEPRILILETAATLNAQPPPYKHPHPITPQYYLAEIATDAETDVVVAEVDFKAALQELVPSVSANEMEHYRQVQQKFAKDTINAKKANETEEELPSTSKGKGKAKAID
ncbi:peroxisomal assembly protein [Tulasnella sp. 427]|nr:peroxisomal assembly protein [Tulasnella sp. 427]